MSSAATTASVWASHAPKRGLTLTPRSRGGVLHQLLHAAPLCWARTARRSSGSTCSGRLRAALEHAHHVAAALGLDREGVADLAANAFSPYASSPPCVNALRGAKPRSPPCALVVSSVERSRASAANSSSSRSRRLVQQGLRRLEGRQQDLRGAHLVVLVDALLVGLLAAVRAARRRRA